MTTDQTYHRIQWAGIVITLLGAVFFSTKAVIVKLAFNNVQVDAVSLLMVRMLFSLPFYIVAAWLAGRKKDNIKLSTRQWLYITGLALFGYYLSSLFDFMGLQFISAGLERLILFLYPTFSVLINAALFKEKISKLQWIALLLTYSGITIAYAGELNIEADNPNFFRGSFLVFLCAITFAIYTVGSGKMIPQVGVTKFTAYAMLASTIGVFAHFIIEGRYEIFNNREPQFIWYGLLLAIVATVIPSFLISAGMKRIGSNNVAIISSVGPISTILQAHLLLNEPIFAAQIAGTLLVLAGVLLTGWKFRKTVT